MLRRLYWYFQKATSTTTCLSWLSYLGTANQAQQFTFVSDM